jgi:hypothetical protein
VAHSRGAMQRGGCWCATRCRDARNRGSAAGSSRCTAAATTLLLFAAEYKQTPLRLIRIPYFVQYIRQTGCVNAGWKATQIKDCTWTRRRKARLPTSASYRSSSTRSEGNRGICGKWKAGSGSQQAHTAKQSCEWEVGNGAARVGQRLRLRASAVNRPNKPQTSEGHGKRGPRRLGAM